MSTNTFLVLALLSGVLIVLLSVLVFRSPLRRFISLKSHWAALRQFLLPHRYWQGLQHLIEDLHTRHEWRYQTPWVLIIGEARSGKSSIAHSVGAGQKSPALLKRVKKLANTLTSTQGWHFTDKGIVIDIGQQTAGKKGFTKTLHLLHQLRPERPVDALVLTVSADTLINADTTQLKAVAQNLLQQLWVVQKRFEFILPVYLLISQVDRIPGFDDFWAAQSGEDGEADRAMLEPLYDQIFGWSSPLNIDAKYQNAWVDEALQAIKVCLYEMQARCASQNVFQEPDLTVAPGSGSAVRQKTVHDNDLCALFPRALEGIRHALVQASQVFFGATVYQTGVSVRGIYFCGKCKNARRVRFVEDLFSEKIFAEKNLARPLRRGVWSRNDRLRRVQYVTLAVALGLFLSLGVNGYRLAGQVHLQSESVTKIENAALRAENLSECVSADAFFALLEEIGQMKRTIRYWNIPWSLWYAGTSTQTAEFIANSAFEGVIFPTLQCYLQRRADDLIDEAEALPPNDYNQVKAQLFVFLDKVLVFEYHLDLFGRITRPIGQAQQRQVIDDFKQLVIYLFHQPLAQSVIGVESVFKYALFETNYTKRLGTQRHFSDHISEGMHTKSRALQNSIQRSVDEGSRIVKDLHSGVYAQGEAHAARQLREWISYINKHWIDSTDTENTCADAGNALDKALQTLKTDYAYDSPLFAQAQALFSGESCYQPLSKKLQQLNGVDGQPLFVISDKKPLGLQFSTAFRNSGLHIDDLLSQGFMSTRALVPFTCVVGSQWHRQPLSQALASLNEYQVYLSGLTAAGNTHTTGNTSGQPPLQAMASAQIESIVADSLQRAQQRPATGVSGEALVATSSRLFASAVDELTLLAYLFDQLQLDYGKDNWRDCIDDYAISQLTQVSGLLRASPVFIPSVNQQGGTLYQSFDKTASANDFFNSQLGRAKVITEYARPYIKWFDNKAGASAVAGNSDEIFWQNSLRALDQYVLFQSKTSSVSVLQDFFTRQLAGMNDDNCLQRIRNYIPPALGDDVFSARMTEVDHQVLSLCDKTGQSRTAGMYQQLSEKFNQLLAARFPFGGIASHSASVIAVQQFFDFFNDNRAQLQEEVQALDAEIWDKAQAFIDQLTQIEPFFAALIGTAGELNPVQLTLQYRMRPAQSQGSEQVVSWQVVSGAQSVSYPNGGNTLVWQPDTTLAFDFQWANLSAYQPTVDIAQPSLSVEGDSAHYARQDTWGLLRFIREHKVEAAVGRVLQQPIVLRFSIPTKARVNHASNKIIRQTDNSLLFIGIAVQVMDATTRQWVPLAVPAYFPTTAPRLAAVIQ